jgi:hypothetical protein
MSKRRERKVSRPDASTKKRAARALGAVGHLAGDAHVGVLRELHVGDAALLDRLRAHPGAVAEQDLVELRAAHLVGRRIVGVPRQAEVEGHGLLHLRRDELGAVLHHADLLHLLAHAEPLEQRRAHRQHRLADVEARMALLVGDHRFPAALSEQPRRRRARRPAAQDKHIAVFFHLPTPRTPNADRDFTVCVALVEEPCALSCL